MELSELFTRGTPAAEVPADFRGMPGREWLVKRLGAISRDQAREIAAFWKRFEVNGQPPLADRKIVTPRDEYGMKSLRGR
jgi:hypothetical protein